MALRAVPRWSPRPSVIVDMSREPHQRMTPPLVMRELDAMRGAAVPTPVFIGMWVAAWARAEHCPLNIISGRFEPHCKYTPSDDLWCAVAQTGGELAGVLGFGVPIMINRETKRAWAASWPFTWEIS
jgi:hypothetical protein